MTHPSVVYWSMPTPQIDPQAWLHPSVWVGSGSVVWGLARIHADVHLGTSVSVGELTYIGRGAHIGDSTRISACCYLVDHITVGERVFFGPCVVTTNDRHPVVNNPYFKRESPIIEDDVSIGANATILPGVRLGRGCKIEAGAVVTRDVPAYETWAGNPAQRLYPAVDLTRTHLDDSMMCEAGPS